MKKIAMSFFILSSSTGWAMQAMDDAAMTQVTAQDGVSIGIQLPDSTLSFNQINLVDTDGTNDMNQAASLVIAPTTNNATQGVRFFNAFNTPTQQAISINIDAGTNAANQSTANINVALPQDLSRIRINPLSIYLAPGRGEIFTARKVDLTTTNSVRTNVREILQIGEQGVDIVFKSGEAVGFNLQFGHEDQGHLLKFSSGTLLCVANNAMCVTGDSDNASNPIQVHSVEGSSLKFGFKLSASNQTTGLRFYDHDGAGGFSGFYGDIDSQGLLIGADGTMDKFDLTLTNITMGDKTAVPNTNTFNGLNNGSMGNIGLTGVQVTDFKATIRGM
ncbi:DUF6160 family protein [Acinetobacter puyangensis]|nr:DUF6160 family protein [Acinetobacter puyangensis]